MKSAVLHSAGNAGPGIGRRVFWAGTILCTLVLLSAGCQGKAERVEKLLASGKAYYEEEKYREALIQFRNVIHQDPMNVEGYMGLGRCFLRLKEPMEAFRAFNLALDLDPDLRDAQVVVGNLALLQGNVATAEAMGMAMVDRNEGDWEGWLLLTRAALGQQDDASAEEALAAAIAHAPEEVQPRILQGRILERKGEVQKAGEHYEKLRDRFPESFEVERVLYQYYASHRKLAEFTALAEQTLPREAHRAERLQLLSVLYVQLGMVREAERVVSLALDEDPDDPDLRLLAGRVFLARGDAGEAEKQWRKGLELDERNPRIREVLAELLLRQERMEDAAGLASETLERDPGNPGALLLMGRVSLARKQFVEAQNSFRKALERDPGNAAAQFFLGMAHASTGERNLAVQNLRELLEDAGYGSRARRALGELYLQGGEVHQAEEMLAPLAAGESPDKEVAILYSEVLRRTGRLQEAMDLLEREKMSYPLDKAFPLLKGRVRMTMGDLEGAARDFQDALRLDPTSHEAVLRLAQITLQREGPEKAAQWIKSRLADMENRAPFYDMLGKIALHQGRSEEAEDYLKKGLDADPNQLEGYISLASLYLRLETVEMALEIVRELEKQKPDNPVGPMLQGMILESMGRKRDAMAQYEKVLAMRPDFGPAANNLAYLYLEVHRDPQSALPLAELARRELPDHPAVADTLGWVYQKKGLHYKAMNLFLEALEHLPDQPTIHYHLGVSYASQGMNDLARESFTRALAISGTFAEADDARKMLQDLRE